MNKPDATPSWVKWHHPGSDFVDIGYKEDWELLRIPIVDHVNTMRELELADRIVQAMNSYDAALKLADAVLKLENRSTPMPGVTTTFAPDMDDLDAAIELAHQVKKVAK